MTPARRRITGWAIFAAVLCLAWFLYCLFGPDPPIIVSRETTFITEPLGEDGLPDYVAYWVQQASEGVTPENNAAVLLWHAQWPGDLAPEHQQPFCDALGIAVMPQPSQSLIEPDDKRIREKLAAWLSEQFVMPAESEPELWHEQLRDVTADAVIDQAMERPWNGDQIPVLADWVEDNKAPLDLLVVAASRSRYYSPPPSLNSNADSNLVAAILPDIGLVRAPARSLKLRAMRHLGEGQLTEAWEDLRACHRLARLAAQNPTVIGQLVAIAVDGITCNATQQLLHSNELDERLAEQILADLMALPRGSDAAHAIDQGERLLYVDSIRQVASGEAGLDDIIVSWIDPSANQAAAEFLGVTRIDWNQVLEAGNNWYDRIASAGKLSSRAERQKELERIGADLSLMSSTNRTPNVWARSVMSRSQRSKMVADIALSVSSSILISVSNGEDRARTTSSLLQVAAALAVHRVRKGEYPDQLAELVPAILPELPLDLYSGESFHYRRTPDDGYLLYSIFQNNSDDHGTDYGGQIRNGEWVERQEIDANKSDLVIRVPVPPFRLPDPPLAE